MGTVREIRFLLPVFSLVEALLPADCPVCRMPLGVGSPGGVCAGCWGRVLRLPLTVCGRCSDACEAAVEGAPPICAACRLHPPPFEAARAVAPFEGSAREILHCFKFNDQPELARPLGREMAGLLTSSKRMPEIVVPVPQRLLKRRLRGYDPAGMLAREVSSASGIPVLRRVLIKVRRTRDQASLTSPAGRSANILGAFRAGGPGSKLVLGKRILLVDDVLTTGATAADCARALLDAGASRVEVLTFARTLRTRRP